jgi:hypothetical protein
MMIVAHSRDADTMAISSPEYAADEGGARLHETWHWQMRCASS